MSARTDSPQGEVFLDARGNGRAMRLTWHHETDIVVLSLWREGICAGTFRLSRDDVNEFIDALVEGLRDAPGVQFGAHTVAGGSSARQPDLPVTGQTAIRDVEHTPDELPLGFTDWAFGDSASANAS